MREKIEQLRAHAAALRKRAAQSTASASRDELLLAARECEKLAVEFELEMRTQRTPARTAEQRAREPQKPH